MSLKMSGNQEKIVRFFIAYLLRCSSLCKEKYINFLTILFNNILILQKKHLAVKNAIFIKYLCLV